ncbi:hypothetical protein DYB35_009718 [Aphanomyces astaci]|uniref:Uncharacterized protein n=1 Tax=Aphanomyces astaci TaxID=112090 RepID=A0A418DTP5_APHAT|nr:hypothetical protein DYB35_009718 [Aphanomyces astaci]
MLVYPSRAINFPICLVPLKSRKPSSAAALKMSKMPSVKLLRETITHGVEKSNFQPEDVSGPTIHPDEGVSNTSLLTQLRSSTTVEIEVGDSFDPPGAGSASPPEDRPRVSPDAPLSGASVRASHHSQGTSVASPSPTVKTVVSRRAGHPCLANPPVAVRKGSRLPLESSTVERLPMSSQDLTQPGAPRDGGRVQTSPVRRDAVVTSEVTEPMRHEAESSFIGEHLLDPTVTRGVSDGDGSIPGVNLADLRVQLQVPHENAGRALVERPFGSTATACLAPTSLVNNEAGHTTTNRAPVCDEPPRTGDESTPTQENADPASGAVGAEESAFDRDSSNKSHHDRVDHGQSSHGRDSNHSSSNTQDQTVDHNDDAKSKHATSAVDKSGKHTSKPKHSVKSVKFREAGGHAVADDDIARCEAVADAFYKNPDDMDAFIEDILLMPQSQVYELTIRLGEGYRDWKEKALCNQFVKENPGSLWGSKFKDILIHKRDPVTMVISCYSLATCIALGGTTFKLGGKEFQVPKYSQYANNYHITFNKVNNPFLARALVKALALMTKCVIAAFNPTSDQNVASPHLRVIFKTSSPPAALVPKNGPPLREITVVDPSGQAATLVFQHKIAVLNKHIPPSVKARQRPQPRPDTPTNPNKSTANTSNVDPETRSSVPSGAEAQRPSRMDTGIHREAPPSRVTSMMAQAVDHVDIQSNAGSDMSIGQDHDPTPDPTPSIHDEAMDGSARSATTTSPTANGNSAPMQSSEVNDAEAPPAGTETNTIHYLPSNQTQPAFAPEHDEQVPSAPLEYQLVTGDRFKPASKRPLSPRESQSFATSNRYALLQEDDVELSLEDFAIPRVVLEDTEHPRTLVPTKKKVRPNKSKHAHFERAAKIIKDKVVEKDIVECTRLLQSEPQVVAHSMYPVDAEFGLLESLVSTRAINRRMAAKHEAGEGGDYKQQLPFYAQGCQDPNEIAREMVSDQLEYTVWQALAAVDLFLSNRVPDLYNNPGALEILCGQEATRWEDVLTDWSLLKVVSRLAPALRAMNLPTYVLDAIEFLADSVLNNSPDIDPICDDLTHCILSPAWDKAHVEA